MTVSQTKVEWCTEREAGGDEVCDDKVEDEEKEKLLAKLIGHQQQQSVGQVGCSLESANQ